MAKRFFASEIWEEDWFLDMPAEYRQFWFYMIGKCDHAGVFRVNMKSARGRIEGDLRSDKALAFINIDKQRIRVLKNDVWFIEDFFVFQYGAKFNINNKVHESIAKVYAKHGIDINSIRGLTEVNLTSKRPQKDPDDGAKDKDKDKERERVEVLEGKEDDKGGMGGEAGEKGGKEEGRPPTQTLVPQMHSIWTTTIPGYTANQELDYPALRTMAVFIFKTAGLKQGFGNVDQEIKVLNTFQLIADQVNREPFWAAKSLSSIANHIQEFYNKIKNPTNGTGTSKPRNGTGVDQDRLKQKTFEAIDARRKQAGR